jgi:hypothetical protein
VPAALKSAGGGKREKALLDHVFDRCVPGFPEYKDDGLKSSPLFSILSGDDAMIEASTVN